jgi:hypothetical protein
MPICRAIPPPLGPDGRVGSFAACQIYIEGQERDRPSHTFFRDVVSLDTAALEMDAQADLSRCRDPVCHWIISYHADEPAADHMIEADTYALLEAIELGRHQFIAAVHDDTDNRHVHVVANRVGPDGKAAQMAWYKYHSERCMAGVALSRDVPVVPGKFNRDLLAKQQAKRGAFSRDRGSAPDLRARLSGRDRARLERGGELPWYELARPAVTEAARNAAGWQQFSAALSRHGIVLKHTVHIAGKDGRAFHGLAFAEGHEAGAPGCKASAIGSDFRYKALAVRWGEYPDDVEGRARAALLARPGIPGRGEVARTHGEGREAARQRRARALDSTVAVETGARMPLGHFTNNDQTRAGGVAVSEEKRYPQLGADPGAQMQAANLARPMISLPMARRAAEHILTGLRAKAGRSKRRRRMGNVQRWSSRLPTVSEPKVHPKGRGRQSAGILRTLVQADSGEGQLPDRNIRDHHSLKQQYVAYRAKERLALKVSEDEAWRRAWGQEQAIRRQETDRLRRSEQVKRRLIIEGLQPGWFRQIWLEGLKLRYRFKRARLKARQSERWARTRSQWTASRTGAEPLGYKAWLRECAATDPVAGRHHAWIDSMDARRAAAMPAAQSQERDEQQMRPSEADGALPKTLNAAEPAAQPVAEPVSLSDMKRDPSDMSPGHFRLLAAAKRAKIAGAPTVHEMVVESRGSAESDALAHPAAVTIQHGIDGQLGNVASRNLQNHSRASSVIAAAQAETAHVADGAVLRAGMAPDACVEKGENAFGVEVSEKDAHMDNNVGHQGRAVAQASHSGLSIGEQAREVALRSQVQAVPNRVAPGGASETRDHGTGEERHVRSREERPDNSATASPPTGSKEPEILIMSQESAQQTEPAGSRLAQDSAPIRIVAPSPDPASVAVASTLNLAPQAPEATARGQKAAQSAEPATLEPTPTPLSKPFQAVSPATSVGRERRTSPASTPNIPAEAPAVMPSAPGRIEEIEIALPIETETIKPLNPLVTSRGKPTSDRYRRIASTIIQASETRDDALLCAAICFFATILRQPVGIAEKGAVRFAEWARTGSDRGALPQPFATADACDAAHSDFVRKSNGRGMGD